MAAQRERGLKQLPDGRWQFSWKYQGKYHRFKANTKTEARAQRERIKTEIRAGKYRDPQRAARVTFEKAVERFLTWSETTNRKATFRNDRWVAAYWLASPHLAGKYLDQVNGGDVDLFKQALAKAPRGGSRPGLKQTKSGRWRLSWCTSGRYRRRTFTGEAQAREALAALLEERGRGPEAEQLILSKCAVDRALARLKRLFSLCVDWGLLERSPAERIKLFREDVNRVRFLTDEEEDRLLAAAAPRLRLVIVLALHTGMRKAEILGLRWQDVDLKNAVAFIPATRAKAKRDRAVHLNERALAVLKELPRSLDGADYVFKRTMDKGQPQAEGDGGETQGKVLSLAPGPRRSTKGAEGEGKPPRLNLGRLWSQAVADAGLENFRFHDLRHTFASRLAMAGVDLNKIRELMGHSGIAMTLRYAHLAPSELKDAVKILAVPKVHGKVHAG